MPLEKKDYPGEEVQKITEAPHPLTNCENCGLWMPQGGSCGCTTQSDPDQK